MRASCASKEYIHSCRIRVNPAPLNPCTTIHGRPIPPGYTSVTVEQIVGNNEDLELDFVGGDGEKTLGDALHGVVLWRKADIKLTASTTAPVQTDRPSPRSPSPPSPQPPPSPPSPPAQRATSTPTPPTLEKGKKKTASLPAARPSKKKQKTVERQLTYEKTAEELEEETARYIKEQLKPKVPPPREKVPLELGKKLLANLDNPPKPKSLPSDYDRTLTKAHKVRNLKKKCGKTIPQLGTQQKGLEPLRVPGLPLLHPTDVQLQADLQAAIFLSETRLTLEEATGQVEVEIPVAPVLTPFQHGKPFVTEEEQKSLGTQIFNLHRWYL